MGVSGHWNCSECWECQAEMLLGSRPQFAGRSLHQWTGPKTRLCNLLCSVFFWALFALDMSCLNMFEHLRHAHNDLPWLIEQNVVGTFEA